ncbi:MULTISPECIES: helix-turn-helix domain-containing protein [Vibrio]|uniref:helix-turn-helix domain-containing protein n=1 Tax=Vibrio TaxID=662 RepID=UPI0009B7BC41
MQSNNVNELPSSSDLTSSSTCQLINELRSKRNRINMSQEDLASFCDTSASHISKIENLRVVPRLDTFLRMCLALNVEFTILTR